MKNLWLSYSWKDNVDEDVDFVAQQIANDDIAVHQDKFTIIAGQRLWPQIEKAISDPKLSDGWAIFLTLNSLNSEPVREEMAYALDRALKTRGGSYPLIGIGSGAVPSEELPSMIGTRLYVDLKDRDWVERVRSGLLNQNPSIARRAVSPVQVTWHLYNDKFVLEVRPRAGRWHPAYFSVNEDEKYKVTQFGPGPSGGPSGFTSTTSSDYAANGQHIWRLSHNITPIDSMYVYFGEKPSIVYFGDGQKTFQSTPD